MIQWLQPILPQDRWTVLALLLALTLRQSPAEAALTAFALRMGLARLRQGLSRVG